MGLWKENIDIYYKLLEPCFSNRVYPKIFGGMLYLLPHILLIDFLLHSLITKAPMSLKLLHCKSPDLSNLRVFGSLCYATNNLPHKDKLDPRALPAVFIGYPPSQKAYKLYDLLHKKNHHFKGCYFP